MTVNSLSPYYVEINYHSAYAPHVMTMPLIGWSPGTDPTGDLELADGGSDVAGDVMLEYISLIAPFFPATVEWDYWTIFSMPTPTDTPIPVAAAASAVVGSNATPGNTKAVQATWTFKTNLGGIFKIVMLDMGNNNSFERVNFVNLGVAGTALVDYIVGDTSPFQGRDNGRPTFFMQIAYDLNDKLREQYHMN
jgi:hypothetical protein